MLKKDWYMVTMPKAFGGEEICEVMSADTKNLIGRRVEIGLNDINKDLSKFYVKAVFKIDAVSKDSATTKFDGHRCLREYISHIVRPSITRVDSNTVVTTKDGFSLRVKGLLLFSRNVNRPICSKAIALMNKIALDYAAKSDFDSFAKALVFGDVAHEMKKQCAKIYPVSKCEIRKSEVVSDVRKAKL